MHGEWLHFYTQGQGSFDQVHSVLLGLAIPRKGTERSCGALHSVIGKGGPSSVLHCCARSISSSLGAPLCSVFDELLF